LETPQCIHDDGQILGKFAVLAQDALVSALKQWPKSGIPDKPGAWLMPAAKLRAFDRLRRTKLIARKHEELGRERAAEGEAAQPDLHAALDDNIACACISGLSISCRRCLFARRETPAERAVLRSDGVQVKLKDLVIIHATRWGKLSLHVRYGIKRTSAASSWHVC
jgi:hypothetical protein